jgi:hypothetical protein
LTLFQLFLYRDDLINDVRVIYLPVEII